MNVLFTSAGRRVELLRAFRAALDRLGLRGQIVATDIEPLAPALHVADVAYVVPRFTAPEYVPTLRSICERESIGLVFPLIDPDIPVLAANRETLESTGARVAVPDVAAVARAADKWETYNFFCSIGVDTPRSWLPGDAALAVREFPVFIKPRRGSASQHTFRVDSREQLDFFVRYVPAPIIQEFVGGAEITTDVVCGHDGTLLGMVSRRRLETRGGEVMKGVTVHDPAVLDGCERIARAMPARGPITVQCILRDGAPLFTEINARFGGGLPLGIAAGLDAPALALAHATGIRGSNVPPQREYRVGMYTTRFDDAFFLGEGEREQMASRRL